MTQYCTVYIEMETTATLPNFIIRLEIAFLEKKAYFRESCCF